MIFMAKLTLFNDIRGAYIFSLTIMHRKLRVALTERETP